jgi:hypothetical protein
MIGGLVACRRADARGRDGGVRQELAAGVRFRRQTGKTFARSEL